MNKRILCLCLALTLLCGCGKNNETEKQVKPTTSTTTTHTATTDSATTTAIADTITVTKATVQTTATSSTKSTTTTDFTTLTSIIATGSAATTTPTPSDEHIIFKATIRDNVQKQPISGITVTVFSDGGADPVGSAVTDPKGVVNIPMKKGNSYRVVLSTLPSGYEANADYRFSTNTVNITIRKAAVQNELDHSEAQYAEGKTMTDFTLTDTDGITYRLSALLQEKQLVILNFWYTTCEPCKLEFPYFEAAIEQYGDRMTLLAVDPIDSMNAIIALRNQLNAAADTSITFPMLPDTCKLSLGFSVSAYPVTVFIDASGRILKIHKGAFETESDFLTTISKFLP